MKHGCNSYEMAMNNANDNAVYNNAMVAASRITMEIILREAGSDIFGEFELFDRCGWWPWCDIGSHCSSFPPRAPHVKCSVLDLPHVIEQAPSGGTVQFIAGDMFNFIPKADALYSALSHNKSWHD
ncbi:hypothetical protein EJB05_14175, partial [Eragrostis curvula]